MSFWEVIDHFVLLTQATLAASQALLQQLLACQNFTLDTEVLFYWYKRTKEMTSMSYGSSTSSLKPCI